MRIIGQGVQGTGRGRGAKCFAEGGALALDAPAFWM